MPPAVPNETETNDDKPAERGKVARGYRRVRVTRRGDGRIHKGTRDELLNSDHVYDEGDVLDVPEAKANELFEREFVEFE